MFNDPPYSNEFRRRRKATGRAVLPWIAVLIAGPAFYYSLGIGTNVSWWIVLPMVSWLVGLLGLGVAVHKHFRCPGCNFVIARGGGVIVSPIKCPNCGRSPV